MNETTKQLFNAPLRAEEYKHGKGAFVVRNNGGYLVAENMSGQDAARLTSLPELYDALADAVEEACQDCVDETYQRTGMLFEPVKYGCIYPERDCCPKCRSWIALLKKVRDYK